MRLSWILLTFSIFMHEGLARAESIPTPISIHSMYVGEELRNRDPVHYVTPEQLRAYEVTIRDGKLYNAKGELLNSFRWELPSIYIMTEDKKLYVSLYQKHNQFHHSSLARGGQVIAAGDINVHEGIPIAIDNRSGHYRPGVDRIDYMKKYFTDAGVDTSQLKAYPDAAAASMKQSAPDCLRATVGAMFNH
jgi:hypothetical protein